MGGGGGMSVTARKGGGWPPGWVRLPTRKRYGVWPLGRGLRKFCLKSASKTWNKICSLFYLKATGLGICSFTHSLKLLRINEQMWAIHSGPSGQMSELLSYFDQITHFLFHSEKMSDSLKKIFKNSYFLYVLYSFWSFLKKQKIHSFLLSEMSELLRSVRTNDRQWAICSGRSEGMSDREGIA